jgi:uncharacterized protein YkwD
MIVSAICLMIIELLLGLFIYFNFFSEHNLTETKVLGEINQKVQPKASQFLTSANLEKPSPLPSKLPKTKASAAIKSADTTKINSQAVLQALNEYRSKNGAGDLQTDRTLQEYAQRRAEYLKSLGRLDKHAGHKEFMADGGFNKLGFNAVAENQSYNYRGSAQGLIENLYGKSSEHIGIGISGAFTNLVFGGKKR